PLRDRDTVTGGVGGDCVALLLEGRAVLALLHGRDADVRKVSLHSVSGDTPESTPSVSFARIAARRSRSIRSCIRTTKSAYRRTRSLAAISSSSVAFGMTRRTKRRTRPGFWWSEDMPPGYG